MPAARAAWRPYWLSSTTAHASGATPISSRGVEEQIRSRFAVLDLGGAEDASFEARVEAGDPQGEAHLVVAPAGCHAGGKVRERIEGVDDALDGGEFSGERIVVEGLELFLPVGRQAAPEVLLHLPRHRLAGAAHEPVDDLGLGEFPSQLGQDECVHAHRDAFAVDQHAVAVEYDEFDRLDHARRIDGPSPSHGSTADRPTTLRRSAAERLRLGAPSLPFRRRGARRSPERDRVCVSGGILTMALALH